MKILGIDEAGRGPVIGPMVMAGFMIDDSKLDKLKGVKDSKMHKPKEREVLFEKLTFIASKYEILIANPPEIDAALADPYNNLNLLEGQKMIELINLLKPDRAIIDCPSTNIKAFTETIRKGLTHKTELILEHKADENHTVVSAASILAKVTRDKAVKMLRDIYGDFGSGYMSDPKTQEFIKKDHNLPIYRRSWVTWKRIKADKSQKRLGEF